MTCAYCQDKPVKGVHCPTDFDDRPGSQDGMVWVAACDECGTYKSDMDAAVAVARLTGWKLHKSYDTEFPTYYDTAHIEQARSQHWHRPFFEVTLAEAQEKVG